MVNYLDERAQSFSILFLELLLDLHQVHLTARHYHPSQSALISTCTLQGCRHEDVLNNLKPLILLLSMLLLKQGLMISGRSWQSFDHRDLSTHLRSTLRKPQSFN